MAGIIMGFLSSFTMTFITIPWVIRLAHRRQWLDKPCSRSSHFTSTPTFGGIVIFFSVLLASLAWIPREELGSLQFVLVASVIIALIGLRDDIDPISPWQKLIGEVFAALVLVFAADIRFLSLHGLFGMEVLPYSMSIVLSVLAIVVIINGFNLIDGINGLSGTIALIIAASLGSWFFLTGEIAFAVLSFVLGGSVLAFLRFNYTPSKIFMGDTGALFCGLLMAVLVIRFINAHFYIQSPYAFEAVPVIAIALFILPLLDSLRVFIMRISEGRSPLHPDRKHIHHVMIDSGLSHTQATVFLSSVNLLVVFSAIQLQWLGSNGLLLAVSIFALLFTIVIHAFQLSITYKRRFS